MPSQERTPARRPEPDELLVAIATYALGCAIGSERAYESARCCLMDSLACALEALEDPACARLLGPVVPGATLAGGARVPGTSYELDPVQAAFDIGAMIGWLDCNDVWLAAERGHPSDNLGAILAAADFLARKAVMEGRRPLAVRDLLTAMIKAYEIQGVLALESSCARAGLDHAILVRVASTAVVAAMLGGSREQVIAAVSNAWLDGGTLRLERHPPATGSRRSWAAGDAASRAVRHAILALAGERGHPRALSAPQWGFCDALLGGRPLALPRPFGSYVMERVLFRSCWPAELHAQTAVECALQLHGQVAARLENIERVLVETQEPALRLLAGAGPLAGPVERERCLRYIVAVPLVLGRLTAEDYGDAVAADPRIERLRARMQLVEDPGLTATYHASDERCIGSALQVRFTDGSSSTRVQIDCPIGHPRRRAEALPLIAAKFRTAVRRRFPERQAARLEALFADPAGLDALAVTELMAALVGN